MPYSDIRKLCENRRNEALENESDDELEGLLRGDEMVTSMSGFKPPSLPAPELGYVKLSTGFRTDGDEKTASVEPGPRFGCLANPEPRMLSKQTVEIMKRKRAMTELDRAVAKISPPVTSEDLLGSDSDDDEVKAPKKKKNKASSSELLDTDDENDKCENCKCVISGFEHLPCPSCGTCRCEECRYGNHCYGCACTQNPSTTKKRKSAK